MKISIVIPVYNVENYLKQCVESVLLQSFSNIEVILVNDGSTDSSGELCNELAKTNSKIKVINKENGGLSDARNAGLKISSGDYIMFLDSDDYWNGDFLSDIADKINKNPKLDFITADGYTGIFPKGRQKPSLCHFQEDSFVYQNGEKFLEYVFSYKNKKGGVWGWEAWRNVYRTALLKENNLYFKKGIIIEDAEWTPRVILASNYFDYYEKPYYMYRLSRPDSIMNVCTPKKVFDYLDTVNNWISNANDMENKKLSNLIKERFSNNFFFYLTYVYLFDGDVQGKLIRDIEKSSFIHYVTKPEYKKWVHQIERRGYPFVMKKLNRKYRFREYLKKIAIELHLIDR